MPTFFETELDFRKWLHHNHQTEQALLVGFYKTKSGKKSMSWSQSVDQALCYGWIDGVRKSIDNESYSIRFTPRKPKSIWSTININKIAVLTASALMMPAGQKAFKLRTENKSNIYAYENPVIVLDVIFEKQFKQNKVAWEYFNKQAPSYKRGMIYWIMTAKQAATKQARLQKTIVISQQQKRMLR
jgi:uncharacterized protein YdeI (YjbR/CyaY-like superfamily)